MANSEYPHLAKARAVRAQNLAKRKAAAPTAATVKPRRSPGRPTLTADAKQKTRLGLRALKAKIQLRGLDTINKQTFAGRLLFEWRQELITALGGEEQVTPQIRALIDLACQSKAIVDHVTAFIMEQESLVIKRRKAVIPVVMQRAQLAAQLEKTLTTLGLQRIAKQSESLAQYSERRRREIDEEEARASVQPSAAQANADVVDLPQSNSTPSTNGDSAS
jgi:hypothetical protein